MEGFAGWQTESAHPWLLDGESDLLVFGQRLDGPSWCRLPPAAIGEYDWPWKGRVEHAAFSTTWFISCIQQAETVSLPAEGSGVHGRDTGV